MASGGLRDPGPRKPASGPGKFSQRTDGQRGSKQPIRTPDVGNSELQYGDRSMLENAQRAAPIPRAQTPAPAGPPGSTPAPHTGAPIQMPGFVFDTPSARPAEPVTTGLTAGPGAGPEALQAPPSTPSVQEQVLMGLVSRFGNADAAQMLSDIRKFSSDKNAVPGATAQPPPSPVQAGGDFATEAAPPEAPPGPQGPPQQGPP